MKRRTFGIYLGLLCGAGGCARTVFRQAASIHTTGPTLLRLQVLSSSRHSAAAHPILPWDTVAFDDGIVLLVDVAQPAYVYVVDQSEPGVAKLLYPGSLGQSQQRMLPRFVLRLPEGNGEYALRANIEQEMLDVVASLQPLDAEACRALGLIFPLAWESSSPTRGEEKTSKADKSSSSKPSGGKSTGDKSASDKSASGQDAAKPSKQNDKSGYQRGTPDDVRKGEWEVDRVLGNIRAPLNKRGFAHIRFTFYHHA